MSIEQSAIDYLVRRVDTVKCSLRCPLSETFNLYVDNKPKTYKELIDAIKNDKFTLNAKRTAQIDTYFAEDKDELDEDDWYGFSGVFDGIVWNGPERDQKGYYAALASLDKAATDALDIIKTTMDADKRLQALKDFENWTPTVTPATVN